MLEGSRTRSESAGRKLQKKRSSFLSSFRTSWNLSRTTTIVAASNLDRSLYSLRFPPEPDNRNPFNTADELRKEVKNRKAEEKVQSGTRSILSADSRWLFRVRQQEFALFKREDDNKFEYVQTLKFSEKGSTVHFACGALHKDLLAVANPLKLYHPGATKKEALPRALPQHISAISISPDGGLFAVSSKSSSSTKSTLQIYRVDSGDNTDHTRTTTLVGTPVRIAGEIDALCLSGDSLVVGATVYSPTLGERRAQIHYYSIDSETFQLTRLCGLYLEDYGKVDWRGITSITRPTQKGKENKCIVVTTWTQRCRPKFLTLERETNGNYILQNREIKLDGILNEGEWRFQTSACSPSGERVILVGISNVYMFTPDRPDSRPEKIGEVKAASSPNEAASVAITAEDEIYIADRSLQVKMRPVRQGATRTNSVAS